MFPVHIKINNHVVTGPPGHMPIRHHMLDFLAAIGLFFAIEGILFAAFPMTAKQAMAAALGISDSRLRLTGLVSAALGVVIVWLVRG